MTHEVMLVFHFEASITHCQYAADPGWIAKAAFGAFVATV